MKTERRHELQNNELATWLTVRIEKIQPYLKTVLGVLILGLVIILGIFIVQNREQQAAAQADSLRMHREIGSQRGPGPGPGARPPRARARVNLKYVWIIF